MLFRVLARVSAAGWLCPLGNLGKTEPLGSTLVTKKPLEFTDYFQRGCFVKVSHTLCAAAAAAAAEGSLTKTVTAAFPFAWLPPFLCATDGLIPHDTEQNIYQSP